MNLNVTHVSFVITNSIAPFVIFQLTSDIFNNITAIVCMRNDPSLTFRPWPYLKRGFNVTLLLTSQ